MTYHQGQNSENSEYTVGLFGGFYNSTEDFKGWKHTDPIKIKAPSVERAIELAEEEVIKKLRQKFNIEESQIEVIVNYVKDNNNCILYQTPWDEISFLPVSFGLV